MSIVYDDIEMVTELDWKRSTIIEVEDIKKRKIRETVERSI
jgi:hypothetical protein